MKAIVWIKLEIEGPDAGLEATHAVEDVLDAGDLQDAINEAGFDFKVTSATIEIPGAIG